MLMEFKFHECQKPTRARPFTPDCSAVCSDAVIRKHMRICKIDLCKMLKEVKVRTKARRSARSGSYIIWMWSNRIDPTREGCVLLNAAWPTITQCVER